VDGRVIGRVILRPRLVHRHGRRGGVVGDAVVAAGGGAVAIACAIGERVGGDGGDHGAVGHAADRHVVGGAGASEGHDLGAPGGTGDADIAAGYAVSLLDALPI